MTLELLQAVLPVPAHPFEGGSNLDWATIEKTLGIVLPADYKGYVETYGTGCVARYIWPFNPFATNDALSLLASGSEQLRALRVMKDKYGDAQCPYPLYPEQGGLLPWGATDDGDALFWLTTGPADEWPVVINESRGPLFERFDETMTGFLAKLLLGGIVSKILTDNVIDRDASLLTPDAYIPR